MSFTIIGTGSAAPRLVKTNAELSELVDTTDEWIVTRTGIRERHICTEETLSDIACQAAVLAMENAGVAAAELDLIICAVIRGDYITPSLSCVIQSRIGASCPAFDINAACTGFIYALDVAAGFFERKRAKKILIVACEALSKLVDWSDRSTCVLFGDGAGAVVLSEGDDLMAIRVSAKGTIDPLFIPNIGGSSPFGGKNDHPGTYVRMDGGEVYKFAVAAMCGDIGAITRQAGI